MKTFYRLLRLMIHITKARNQRRHLLRFSLAFSAQQLTLFSSSDVCVWVTAAWAVTISGDKSPALVLLWLFHIPVAYWPLDLCKTLLSAAQDEENFLSDWINKGLLRYVCVCASVLSAALFILLDWSCLSTYFYIIDGSNDCVYVKEVTRSCKLTEKYPQTEQTAVFFGRCFMFYGVILLITTRWLENLNPSLLSTA